MQGSQPLLLEYWWRPNDRQRGGKVGMCPDGGCGHQDAGGGWLGAGGPWDGLAVGTWLLVVGPKLETETEIREALSYQSSPGYLEPIVTGVFVWLPGLLLKMVTWFPASLPYSRLASWVMYCR